MSKTYFLIVLNPIVIKKQNDVYLLNGSNLFMTEEPRPYKIVGSSISFGINLYLAEFSFVLS